LNRAAGLAAQIEQNLGLKADLVEDHGGILEVTLNDKIIYSNHRECCQEFVPENIIRDLGDFISSGNISRKELPRKSEGG